MRSRYRLRVRPSSCARGKELIHSEVVMKLSGHMHGNGFAGERFIMTAILLASVSALAVAWIGDFEFNLAACTPCCYQRIPYVIVTAVAAVAMVAQPRPSISRLVVIACALLFATSASFAAFREGVQEGWWSAPSVCEAPLAPALARLQVTLAGTTIQSVCDEAETSVLSMSLTMLNFAYSSALALLCVIVAAIIDLRKEGL
jgi:disulfide bond formation protein DsbB